MNRPLMYLVLTIAAITLTGCVEAETKTTGPSLDGIKFDDLVPTSIEKLPPQINFHIYTFHVPTENASSIDNIFKFLATKPMLFDNFRVFEANGFAAGFGRNQIWNEFGKSLRRAQAIGKRTDALMIFDKFHNDVPIAKLNQKLTIPYTGTNGEISETTLTTGQFAWRIKAESVPEQRGAAQVRIEPVFKNFADSLISRLPGKDNSADIVFDSSSFELTMGEGDFVLLGPGRGDTDWISLDNLSLTSDGDFLNLNENNINKFTLGRLFFTTQTEKKSFQLFLIVCVRVES